MREPSHCGWPGPGRTLRVPGNGHRAGRLWRQRRRSGGHNARRRTAKRVLALVAGLVITTATSAYAQDTSQDGRSHDRYHRAVRRRARHELGPTRRAIRDTTDTSGVQNPPGYHGMERDTTLVPSGATSDSAAVTGAASKPRLDPSSTTAGDSTHDDTREHAVGDSPGSRRRSRSPAAGPPFAFGLLHRPLQPGERAVALAPLASASPAR